MSGHEMSTGAVPWAKIPSMSKPYTHINPSTTLIPCPSLDPNPPNLPPLLDRGKYPGMRIAVASSADTPFAEKVGRKALSMLEARVAARRARRSSRFEGISFDRVC